ncbi:MAG: hypothetical protein EHM38_07110 [Geobacteraceae bacterium]|nr:MAG: hypothetical protein EHM38_07110 [Geobacteraceae bacterium]
MSKLFWIVWGKAFIGIFHPIDLKLFFDSLLRLTRFWRPICHITRLAGEAGDAPQPRNCFATHLLEAGYDIRTVQELMGHRDVTRTQIHMHVLQRGNWAVRSLVRDRRSNRTGGWTGARSSNAGRGVASAARDITTPRRQNRPVLSVRRG